MATLSSHTKSFTTHHSTTLPPTELGFVQDNVDAAEMMIPCLVTIEVQRIADCLKQGPK